MTDSVTGKGAAIARYGQKRAEQAFEHASGLKVKGFFSGIFQKLKAKICGAATPTVTIAAHQATQTGASDHKIRLRGGKSPALALETLRSQVRQPKQASVARASQPLSTVEIARGESQVRLAVIEESVAEQTTRFLRGVRSLESDASRLAQMLASNDNNASVRQQLLAELPSEFAQIRRLQQDPSTGISAKDAQKAKELLALATLRVLAPTARINSVSEEFVEGLALLSEKGVLTDRLLLAIECRSDFWAEQVQGTSELSFIDRTLPQTEQRVQAKAFYIESYVKELVSDERHSDVFARLEEKLGHTKAFSDIKKADKSRVDGLINDLRLKVHENTVNELLQFSDENRDLALDLKLLSARNDQDKQLVTVRHELGQIKKYLFEIAAANGGAIDKGSFQNLAMDSVVLGAWKSGSKAIKEINILIGQALALQSELVELELQQAGQATSGRRQMVDFQDLKMLGLSDKALGDLQKNQADVREILEAARSYAAKGFSSTADLKKFRDQSKLAFHAVLNSRMVNRANADIRSLLPAERAQVLGVLLERNRPGELEALMRRSQTARALTDLTFEGSEGGVSGITQTSADRYRSLEKHVGQEVDRMIEALDKGLSARERLAKLKENVGLTFDPGDKATLGLAIRLRDYSDLAMYLDQMRALESKLSAEIASVTGAPDQARSQTLSLLQQDAQTVQDQIKEVSASLRLLDQQINSAKGPLADRLRKNPETQSLNVLGKLSFDPVLVEAIGALTLHADGAAEERRSESSIKNLSSAMDECLAERRSAMGDVTAEALTNELRHALAMAFSAVVQERQLDGEKVAQIKMLPLEHKDRILAELAKHGINEEVYGPEIRNMLHREIGLSDIEGWLKEAKAVDKQRRAETPAYRRDVQALPAESEQVLQTVVNLPSDHRFFLGAGFDIEATTGKIQPGVVKLNVDVGGGKERLFEVSREGDEAVLKVVDDAKLKLAVGAGVGAKFAGKRVALKAGIGVGTDVKRGEGFVARYKSTQELADGLRRLYVSKGAETSALLEKAISVKQIKDSEFRVHGDMSAGASASAPLPDIANIVKTGNLDDVKDAPFQPYAGISITTSGSKTWRTTVTSDSETVTTKTEKSHQLKVEASIGVGMTLPTALSTLSEDLDRENGSLIERQFADKVDAIAEEGGVGVVGLSGSVKSEELISETAITKSRRDDHVESVSCSFRLGAPQKMTIERLRKVAPRYVDQISALGPDAMSRCKGLFEQIGGSGFELVLTTKLKPEVRDGWNRERNAALQALELTRPTKSAEVFQKEKTSTENSYQRKLTLLIKDEDNMLVTGLELRKVVSSDKGVTLNAALVKGTMTATAGVGELVDQVSFTQQRLSASFVNGANGDLGRLLAESQRRQQELLGRLADVGR